ncbi:MAG: hypothetical protein GXX96_01725 [Planctomycetaceae bacterium]|nr:hypothetical protein [Planctomycetaceae bacterium]
MSASSPEGQDGASARILVGFGPGIDANGLLQEEYVVKTLDNALYIVGEQKSREPMATSYGVYRFLDRELGVRWLWIRIRGQLLTRDDTGDTGSTLDS